MFGLVGLHEHVIATKQNKSFLIGVDFPFNLSTSIGVDSF